METKYCKYCDKYYPISNFYARSGFICKKCKMNKDSQRYECTCAICDKKFRSAKKNTIYCSNKCHGISQRKTNKMCIYCGKEVKRAGKICGKCRYDRSKSRHKHICKNCGREFYSSLVRQDYCGNECVWDMRISEAGKKFLNYCKCIEEYECVSEYVNSRTKVKMKHNKCGREFMVTPRNFMGNHSGCPYCYKSKGEIKVRKALKNANLSFKEQYKIPSCRDKAPLPFDFAVFNKNNELFCLIEYDGIQHFKPKFGDEAFERTVKHDKMKNNFCSENRINLIRIPYTEKDIEKYLYDSMTILSQASMETSGRCND